MWYPDLDMYSIYVSLLKWQGRDKWISIAIASAPPCILAQGKHHKIQGQLENLYPQPPIVFFNVGTDTIQYMGLPLSHMVCRRFINSGM